MTNIFQYGVKAANTLATATRSGLLKAEDFTAIQNFKSLSLTNLRLALDPPRCQLNRNTTQALATGVFTNIIWNNVFTNKAGAAPAPIWNVANPTRLVAPVDGFYQIEGASTFATGAGGTFRFWQLAAPGFVFSAASLGVSAAGQNLIPISGVVGLTAGNYIEMGMQQDSGAAMNIVVFGTTPYITMRWVAPL